MGSVDIEAEGLEGTGEGPEGRMKELFVGVDVEEEEVEGLGLGLLLIFTFLLCPCLRC